MRGGPEEKKPPKMVRSSIACARCRRSKVKCVNNGVHSPCKACLSSNRECTYPNPGSAPATKRSEAPMGIKQEPESGESKKRVRKVEDTGRRNSQRLDQDVLDSPLLTKKVWDELYEIFKLHFSTEMPFLHPPTFRNRMRQAAYPRDPNTPPAEIEEGRVLLLGVLTLTARFHPGLVAHHSPNGEDPLAASEYYATPLAAAFGPTIKNISVPSLENIQALLMLGLYEWGQTRGLSAWLYVGLAIRLAFSMGLAFEDDPDSIKGTRQASAGRHASAQREDRIEKEVRRRTFWSCFIMDRMLAAGKFRPTMISPDKLRVQLPCSDDQFLFVHDVRTGFLTTDWMDDTTAQQLRSTVSDDGVLSRYIRLVEIFGRLSEYSYAGGRRTEKLPPWDESTEFFRLREQLKEFHDALPPSLTFTEANLSAHIEKRNATTYASLHTLYSLCLIVLHREYIPFIPIRCGKPVGPLDEPTFPEDKYEIPRGFWEESAEGIMKASRAIIDIVKTCQENDALPESPQIGFAVWQAAFVSVYAAYFPHMDTANFLTNPGDSKEFSVIRNKGYPGSTKQILGEMVPRLKMVKAYLKSISKMHTYFQEVIRLYYGKFKRKPLEEFPGGGLEYYKKYEKELKEFGDLKDADQTMNSDGSDTVDQVRSRASTSDLPGGIANSEPMQGIEAGAQARPNGAWAPINASSPPVEVEERPKYNYGPSPYGVPYQHSPNQSSNAPSLMSPSNGDSTSGLNSPYANPQAQLYHPASQPQHVVSYPSVAQHTMAPPTGTMVGFVGTDQEYDRWITNQESIRMNTGFDNFAQDLQLDQFNNYPIQQPNFLQAVNFTPQPIAGQSW